MALQTGIALPECGIGVQVWHGSRQHTVLELRMLRAAISDSSQPPLAGSQLSFEHLLDCIAQTKVGKTHDPSRYLGLRLSCCGFLRESDHRLCLTNRSQ